ANWRLFARLVDRDTHRVIAAQDNQGFPVSQWHVGDRVISSFDLTVPPGASSTVADVDVGMMDLDAQRPVPVTTLAGAPLGHSAVVGPVRIARPEAPTVPPTNPLGVRFGSGMTLTGFDVEPTSGSNTYIRLRWQADASMSENYTVFVHLLDASGHYL